LKALAFYLPQYHAIPENDRWWGEGFTEWNNVRSAQALFDGHYQPHVPHARVGYYDLSDPAFIERQHALALRYGIAGFCYYYYNFSGRNPLERPLRHVRSNASIRNEYCFCWANHDWTRTWYGQDKEVLLKQEYSLANAEQLFEDVAQYFADTRYIKVEGKPLFLVYAPEFNPMMREYADLWRKNAQKSGYPDVFLVSVEALMVGANPDTYGFDAALEFAPDWTCVAQISPANVKPRLLDYQGTVKNMLCKAVPHYPRMRCVFPGWDNTPRYKERGIIFTDGSLGAYRFALESAVRYTKETLPDFLQYLFINAWNEWGEGCHLEPDEKNGFLPLQITADVLAR
jgi:hypothetical protein